MSFNINIYETTLRNVTKRASDKLYNVSGTNFINVYIKMTTSIRFFLSHDFSAHRDPLLDTLSTVFSSHVASWVILDLCDIKIFAKAI